MSTEIFSSTLPGLLHERAKWDPHQPACFQRHGGSWDALTWSEMSHHVTYAVDKLKHYGIRQGDPVAILAPTSREWFIAELALMSLGCVVVGIDLQTPADEVRQLCERLGVSVMLTDQQRERSDEVPCLLLEELIQGSRQGPDGLDRPSDPAASITQPGAAVFFTSGTTGASKPISYEQHQLMAACSAVSARFADIGSHDRVMAWLPMSAMFQRLINYLAVARGVSLYFISDPRTILEAIREVHPTLLVGVPRFFEKLRFGIQEKIHTLPQPVQSVCFSAIHRQEQPAGGTTHWIHPRHWMDRAVTSMLRRALGGRLRMMITGSAKTPPQTLQFFQSIGIPLYEAYGITECAIPIACNSPGNMRVGSVGKVFPENELRLAADGEIEVRGPGLSTSIGDFSRMTADGYYRTGDLGHFDEDGFLFLEGRKSALIKTSTGRRISPAKIEAAIAESDLIESALIIGNERPFLTALLVLNGPALTRQFPELKPLDLQHDLIDRHEDSELVQIISQELARLCRHLSKYEQIGGFAILHQPFTMASGEMTPTLKLKRNIIEKTRAATIERLYSSASPRAARFPEKSVVR